MIDSIAKNFVALKKEFSNQYSGTSHIQEVMPLSNSDLFPIDSDHLQKLHLFAGKNPIYYNSYEEKIGQTPCMIYEGDINKFWLNSIQHGSSHAPFSPTWILSAYIAVLAAKELGLREIIDIGSGDGRIAYCGKILDLDAHSIEIDDMLVDLQKSISENTGIDFNPNCVDATKFDYSSLKLTNPAFFIGGLAQMGGNILANSLIEKISTVDSLKVNSTMVFAGTYSKKYQHDPYSQAGWGEIIQQNDMNLMQIISLPTVWTFNEPDETPYIFAKFNSSN